MTEFFFGLDRVLLAPVGGGTCFGRPGSIYLPGDVLPIAVPILFHRLKQPKMLAEKERFKRTVDVRKLDVQNPDFTSSGFQN